MSVTIVNGEQFKQVIKNSKEPVVAYYWAPWCGPCKQQGPIMDKLSRDFDGQVRFIKINSDEELATANANNVRGLPAIHIYENGELVKTFQGALSARKLTEVLSEPFSR